MSLDDMWTDDYPTEEVVERFKYLEPSLESLSKEIKDLSKKNPDDIVTPFKLRLINKALSEIRELLYGDRSLASVEELTEDSLPQFSDVVLVLGQFTAAMARFRSEFTDEDYEWKTKEAIERGDIEVEDSNDDDSDDEDANDEEE